MADDAILLKVEGAVARAVGFTFADLAAFPAGCQVVDVSRFQPDRRGEAVELDALLELAGPLPEATHVTLHADRDDFHVSIPRALLRGQGMVVYRLDGAPMVVAEGGPIRLLIRDPSACHSGELDDCANVKYLSRVELTEAKGRDTRPVDEVEHRALHDGPG